MKFLTLFLLSGPLLKVVIEDAEPHVEHVLHGSGLGIESKYDQIWLRILFINESSEIIKVPGRLPDFKFNKGEGVFGIPCFQEDYRCFWLTIRNPKGDTMKYSGPYLE